MASLLAERGEYSRARAVLESYCAVSGEAPTEICAAMLSVCANLGDLPGAEATYFKALRGVFDGKSGRKSTFSTCFAQAAAQMMLQSGPLSEAQATMWSDMRSCAHLDYIQR